MTVALAGCHNKKVKNPIANVDSKQPDKVLFDRSMEAMKRNKFDVARMTLQTLVNTYPDSEFIARAKLAIGDSWYAEGGTAGLAQAENEYKDFIIFFPNMPEAAEAQMKVAKIHYDQMEKADRDFTHAKRAESAFRDMIQQFPDSPLVPEAKAKLREVQEVLGQREFLIGRFYYLRQSYPASIARLTSLVDTYPLYSGADEALMLLGQAYEREIEQVRAHGGGANKALEASKGRLIKEFEDKATDAYSRLLTRYPVSEYAVQAKTQLQTLNRPIPTATPEAIAQNKAEEESRGRDSLRGRVLGTFRGRPSVAAATKVGDPTMTDPPGLSAPELLKHANDVMINKGSGNDSTKSVTVQAVGTDAPPPGQAVPRSDTQVNDAAPAQQQDNSIPELPINSGSTEPAATTSAPPPATPSNTPVANAGPLGGGDPAPATPPAQVNDVNAAPSDQANASSGAQSQPDDKNMSSSKKKKKKGVGKLNPF